MPGTKTAAKKSQVPKKTKKTAPKEKPFSFISVKVGKLPGRIHTIGLNGGRTVKDALEGAGITSIDGFEIKVNSKNGTLDTTLKNGAVVILVKRIKGNG